MTDAAARGELELVTNPALLAELERVLLRKFEFAGTVTSSIRGELEALCTVVEVAALLVLDGRQPQDRDHDAARPGQRQLEGAADQCDDYWMT